MPCTSRHARRPPEKPSFFATTKLEFQACYFSLSVVFGSIIVRCLWFLLVVVEFCWPSLNLIILFLDLVHSLWILPAAFDVVFGSCHVKAQAFLRTSAQTRRLSMGCQLLYCKQACFTASCVLSSLPSSRIGLCCVLFIDSLRLQPESSVLIFVRSRKGNWSYVRGLM